MSVLSGLNRPSDLRTLSGVELAELAAEIRSFLVDAVCRTGGHLGPNLGVVELTIALERVFDSPSTPLVFDTGHQAYVHKILTGRIDEFRMLRLSGGLSGYPNRSESRHDWVENSHASTAISYADGLSKSFAVSGRDDPVVAVTGDGALTGGLAWEALNNVGAGGRRVVVVLNDNGRSYSPTVGGLASHLRQLRERSGYGALVDMLGGTPVGGGAAPDSLFGALGFDYYGPVDGHDPAALENALIAARNCRHPVVVHCLTEKGRGYAPAENDETDHLHTVGVVDPATGRAPRSAHTTAVGTATWTDEFSDALVRLGRTHPDIVAVSAAMLGPTGVQQFADTFPNRCFDVGIAEQEAITSAAGLAMGGAHPVVSLYSTFAGRAFDQLLLDVGLHGLPVTLSLDRAGITGPDGPSHHGLWDLSVLGAVPGMRVAAPRDAATLSDELEEAIAVDSGPTALRFPKSNLDLPVTACEQWGELDILRAPSRAKVLIVAVGVTGAAAVEAADALTAEGMACSVVDPRWVLPVSADLLAYAERFHSIVTVEDGVRAGGVGSHIAQALASADLHIPVTAMALPTEYLPAGSRSELLQRYGLDAAGIAGTVLGPASGRPSRFTQRRHRIRSESMTG